MSEIDYKATEKGSLIQHIKPIHEGERYPCEKCDYKATQKGSLRQHIKSIHEGERRVMWGLFMGMEILM